MSPGQTSFGALSLLQSWVRSMYDCVSYRIDSGYNVAYFSIVAATPADTMHLLYLGKYDMHCIAMRYCGRQFAFTCRHLQVDNQDYQTVLYHDGCDET